MQDNNSIEVFIPSVPSPLIIDIDDYVNIFQKNVWYYHTRSKRMIRTKKINGRTVSYFLHREIVNADVMDHVDHINHNGMDNRKSNLRKCSRSQNGMNRVKQRRKTSSIYKGVSQDRKKRINSWIASLRISGKYVYLGCYMTEIEAARAYNAGAIKYFGEFTLLNKVD